MEAKYNPYRDNPKRTRCEEGIYDQGYKAGIREVVEWVGGCIRTGDCLQEDGSIAYKAGDIVMTKTLWQSKLKEWGIEAKQVKELRELKKRLSSKPLLLSDEEIDLKKLLSSKELNQDYNARFKSIAQAQREADIEYYEG